MPSLPNDPTLPDWALAQAEASLRIGLSVPEVEQRLVAKGLSPAVATAVVTSVLEGHVRATQAPQARAEQWEIEHQVVSAVVGCVCVLLAYWFGGGWSAGRVLVGVLFPVVCIWYPEVVSMWFPEPVDRMVPPAVLRCVAWVLLLLIAAYRVLLLLFW